MRIPLLRTCALATAVVFAAAGCSGEQGANGEFAPEAVEFVVHTGPGGGSDVFAREVTGLLQQTRLITPNSWTVRNENGGSGAAAMAYLARLSGEEETVALSTPTWTTTPLTTSGSVTLDDLTCVAQLVTEPMLMAVKADAPYNTLQEFVAAARAEPGGLIQTGGSVTSVDAIAGEIIRANTGTDWSYLSFEGGGERIAAVLSGDADMMFGSPLDFTEQVRAGNLKVIATIGSEAPALFPDAPTLAESGIDVPVPQQVRGLIGPPDMSEEARAYYTGLFEKLVATPEWAAYVEKNGLTTAFADGAAFERNMTEQAGLLRTNLDQLGLLPR
ncbi:Bug family tripartite tricarboxylate transporter substrate binding protein [Saccharopolyspora sp. 5N708]|uniref:Bug family tripartite tricarboxylate transporter substrate binding protein n=1 Tax=Saccharopolyspora sp. 5N708 TaxID=3457424 RepID=UPI003FD2C1E7